ncbi:MAG: hypothetical protein HY910_09170 [Desulfarculus sp.]|nr:hypothetical protein [Desulfarculus sp.]
MNLKLPDRRARCFLLGALVLAVGLAGAAWVYAAALRAESEAQSDPQGAVLLMSPEYSKKFLRDLEVYGGKANVLMFKFRAWLEGLFRGKPLAFIIAGLSLLVAGALFYSGRQRDGHPGQPDPRPD